MVPLEQQAVDWLPATPCQMVDESKMENHRSH
jgi:hypothetical protein